MNDMILIVTDYLALAVPIKHCTSDRTIKFVQSEPIEKKSIIMCYFCFPVYKNLTRRQHTWQRYDKYVVSVVQDNRQRITSQLPQTEIN